jgi:hypothetical protein
MVGYKMNHLAERPGEPRHSTPQINLMSYKPEYKMHYLQTILVPTSTPSKQLIHLIPKCYWQYWVSLHPTILCRFAEDKGILN